MKKLLTALFATLALTACNNGGGTHDQNTDNNFSSRSQNTRVAITKSDEPSSSSVLNDSDTPQLRFKFILADTSLPVLPPIVIQANNEVNSTNGAFTDTNPYVVAHPVTLNSSVIMQNDPVANYLNITDPNDNNYNESYWEFMRASTAGSAKKATVFVGYGPDGSRATCQDASSAAPLAYTITLYQTGSSSNMQVIRVSYHSAASKGAPGYYCDTGASVF